MNAPDPVLSVLGLAKRANRLVIGFDAISEKAREGTVALLFLARDCSESTGKSYRDKCRFYQIPYEEYGTMELLGRSVGKQRLAAVAVCDEGFAALLHKKLRG